MGGGRLFLNLWWHYSDANVWRVQSIFYTLIEKNIELLLKCKKIDQWNAGLIYVYWYWLEYYVTQNDRIYIYRSSEIIKITSSECINKRKISIKWIFSQIAERVYAVIRFRFEFVTNRREFRTNGKQTSNFSHRRIGFVIGFWYPNDKQPSGKVSPPLKVTGISFKAARFADSESKQWGFATVRVEFLPGRTNFPIFFITVQ